MILSTETILRKKTPIGHFRQARFCCIAEKPAHPPERTINPPLTLGAQPERTGQSLWGFFMDKMLFALSLGFAGLIFATQAALAAQCAPREQVVAGLATGFDEVRRGAGLTAAPDGRARVIEIFTSASGSWTIVVTRPDGQTCLVASGQAWEEITEELPAKGEPA
jgi:hypothetical protein